MIMHIFIIIYIVTGLDKARQLLLFTSTNYSHCLDLLDLMELDGNEVLST